MNDSAQRPITLAIHWPRFGPYHFARVRAARAVLGSEGIRVTGLEMANQDSVYLWREEVATDPLHYVVFPGRTYGHIGVSEMWRGIASALSVIRPSLIAINGYGSPDSKALLAWSRLHHCPTILMTESKADDAARTQWREWVKRGVVSQFDAVLCGGKPHRIYLEKLGVRPERIVEGYDAVDNDYFWQGAERVRQSPIVYRSLPGLESPDPFFLASARFIKRKNLDGLLRAYAQYRRQLAKAHGTLKPWRLVILGEGPERGALEYLIRAEDIHGVSLPGFRQIDELPAYYGLASVFIHPPYQEQWGLVVNEAMAAGLPVLVSSRCGCASDLVNEPVNGFTFNPEDAESLACLMVRVSSGQVDLADMGRASLARIEAWGPTRFAQGLHGAIQTALRSHVTHYRGRYYS